jgi:uncharacterized membrane protein
MYTKIILGIVFTAMMIVSTSCEQIEKIDKQMDADSTDIANEISDAGVTNTLQAVEHLAKDGHSEILFKASGTEPGWIAEYYTDKFRLVVDYGKDSLIIRNISRYLDPKSGYSFSFINADKGKENRLDVKIEDKECTDAAGNKKPKTVTVTYNKKVYKGCGESVAQ